MSIQRQRLLSPLWVSGVNASSCLLLLHDAFHLIPAAGLEQTSKQAVFCSSLPPAQSKTSLILMNQKGTRACSFFRKSCWLRTTQHIHLSTANVYLCRACHACSHQLEFLHNTTLNLSLCILPVVALPYFISLPSKGSTPEMGPTRFICKKCRRKFEPC